MVWNRLILVVGLVAMLWPLLLCVDVSHADGRTVVIAANAWPPYVEDKSSTSGMATELVVKSLAKVGMKVELVFVPWARALDGVKHGRYAASYPWLITPERQVFAWYTKPIVGFKYVFFYRKDKFESITFQTLKDLRGYSIVGMLGYYYKRMFADANLDVEYKLDGDIAFRMLEAGRADLLAEDEVVGWYRLKRDYPDAHTVFASSRPYTTLPGHMIISKQNPEGEKLLEAFDRGLQVLHETGEYQRIVERYKSKGVLEP